MAKTWRSRIADKYLDVPLAFHRPDPTGELMAHADIDVGATEAINPLPFSIGVDRSSRLLAHAALPWSIRC